MLFTFADCYRAELPMNRNERLFADQFTAIMGAPGSGNSTLMNIIGCLDKPSKGTYHIRGREVARLSRRSMPVKN